MYLNCHTSLSFKCGTLSVPELFAEAVRCGVHKLVLTEINNTASYIEMLRLCEQNRAREDGKNKFGEDAYDLEVALGIEFRAGNELLYVGIARNNNGFEELNRFHSHHNHHLLHLFPSYLHASCSCLFFVPFLLLSGSDSAAQ